MLRFPPVTAFTPKMKSQAAGKMGFSTTEVGDELVKMLKQQAKPKK